MMETPGHLQAAMAALEAQRSTLGAAVVDAALAALRHQLAALEARAAPAQRLRQVSAFFVDVVGSTAMGQKLSPEAISAVMDGALRRFTAVVQAHHGRVLQYTGDGMLAAFGADESHEDDVESAVHAGLAILEDARRSALEVRARHGVADFNVRVGIHTGRVLLGAGVDAEGSIRGSAVNLAARMEQTAPPGSLRISHDTYSHVRGLFDVVEQPPAVVKGVEQPVRGYLVERARPRVFRVPTRGVDGVSSPMVGRDAELAALLAAFDAVRGERALRTVTVVGEAGLGKSRLVAEFRQALQQRGQACWLLLGRAQPRAARRPYGLLHDLLTWHLHIGDDDSADDARSKFVGGLAHLFAGEGEAPLHVLGHLAGLDFSASPHLAALRDDESRLREAAFDAAVKLLQRLGADPARPVVMLLDDVHWADDATLAFVNRFASHREGLPVLCVQLTRPALDGDPATAAPAAHELRIELRALDHRHRQALANALLARIDDAPAGLHRLLADAAEGNPFYMEELLKMLLDDGVIEDVGERWRVLPQKLSLARVPQTLVGVLQARLDALAPAERMALQQAAIVGATFSEAALAAIDAAAPAALPMLVRKQMVRRSAEVFGPAREYAFGHHLLHQVSYDSVLHDARMTGHSRAGAFWRARAAVASSQQIDPGACRALAEAVEHGRIADPRGLIDWFDAQFSNYLRAYVGRVLRPLAQAVVELAESHCGAADIATCRALTNLARIELQQSDSEPAEPLLLRALAIQQAALGDEHPDTARTFATLGGYHQGHGDFVRAEGFLRRALEIRQQVLGVEHALTLSVIDVLAHVVTELGHLDEAESLCRRLLDARERHLGDDLDTAAALTTLGEVLTKQGRAVDAETLIRRALALQHGFLPPENPEIGLTLWYLADALRVQGRVTEAEQVARQTLELWENSMGEGHEWTAWGLISLAELRLELGDGGEAAALAERALRIHERLFGPKHAQVLTTLEVWARALERCGDGRAAAVTQQAQAIRDAAQRQDVPA